MDPEAVQLLREIRDEARHTNARLEVMEGQLDQTVDRLDQTVGRLDQANARLDQTNARLDHTNARLDQTVDRLDQTVDRLDQTVGRLHVMEGRLEVVATTVLELAEQQRFVVRHLRTLAERDHRIDDDVLDLRRRVEKLEQRLDPAEPR